VAKRVAKQRAVFDTGDDLRYRGEGRTFALASGVPGKLQKSLFFQLRRLFAPRSDEQSTILINTPQTRRDALPPTTIGFPASAGSELLKRIDSLHTGRFEIHNIASRNRQAMG
jgi:hypothetical protein